LLESAVTIACAMGETSQPVEIAAAYLFYLSRNRPFMDGNYRMAFLTCLVFLEENRLLPVEQVPGDWETFVLDVIEGKLDKEQTAEKLKGLLQEMRQ
ncbi:MAG: Fic family protein, partial [Chthoniobacterales bacterium]